MTDAVMTAESFLGQNFNELKKNCLLNGILFEDNTFPANKNSISNKINEGENHDWKRPFELFSNPIFLAEKNPHWFISQGELGDCWLISGITVVSTIQDHINRIIMPKEQNFDTNYAGIFMFEFWHYGHWVRIVVDDRLPVKDGKLVFCRNLKYPNEMYGPLLEKAYAKLNKCYFNLISGEINDSLTDLTGGLHQNFNLKTRIDQDQLWINIVKFFNCKSMAGCAIDLPNDKKSEYILENKLRTGHTYAVLEAIEFESLSKKSKIRLLKLRNPWGHEISWTGRWAWDSQEWIDVPENVKKKFYLKTENNGQFCISFQDFLKFFHNLDFVHQNPYITDLECKDWYCEQFNGEWNVGSSAGGSFNSGKESFFSNPKYLITCDQTDSVVISLMQTDTLRIREKIGKLKGSRQALGFHIFTLLNNDTVLNDSNLKFFANSGEYVYKRELNRKFDLCPGRYVLIPACFKKNVNMKYLLRFFSKSKETKIQKLNMVFKTSSDFKANINGKQKIVKKSYINEFNREKNKTIGMHLTKIDHHDYSEACVIM